MKKILYISNSVTKLGELPEYELIREEFTSRLTPGIAELSDLVLIDQADLMQAEQQVAESILSVLNSSRTPVLLLTPTTIDISNDSLRLINSGFGGLVTQELLPTSFELLCNLKPFQQNSDRQVTLSLVEPFAQATSEVLETTFRVSSCLMGIVTGRVVLSEAAISSSMTITGEIEGEAVAALSQAQAQRLVVGILNCDRNEITDSDLLDGVNEVINQVAGRVRTMEWPEKYKFNIDLPQQVECCSDKYSQPSEAAWITLLIECYGQILTVSIHAKHILIPALF